MRRPGRVGSSDTRCARTGSPRSGRRIRSAIDSGIVGASGSGSEPEKRTARTGKGPCGPAEPRGGVLCHQAIRNRTRSQARDAERGRLASPPERPRSRSGSATERRLSVDSESLEQVPPIGNGWRIWSTRGGSGHAPSCSGSMPGRDPSARSRARSLTRRGWIRWGCSRRSVASGGRTAARRRWRSRGKSSPRSVAGAGSRRGAGAGRESGR